MGKGALGRTVLSPDSGRQCKQAAPPGSVGVVRRITLFLKQVGMKAGMADGAGSSRSGASLAAVPFLSASSDTALLAFSFVAVLLSSYLFLPFASQNCRNFVLWGFLLLFPS